jgi:hypothetical protein
MSSLLHLYENISKSRKNKGHSDREDECASPDFCFRFADLDGLYKRNGKQIYSHDK